MSTTTEHVTERHDGNYHEFRVDVDNHTPSWLRLREGNAEFRMTTRTGRRFLDFHLVERAEPDKPDGRWSEKSTFLTLSEETAAKLYAFLKAQFEEAPA